MFPPDFSVLECRSSDAQGRAPCVIGNAGGGTEGWYKLLDWSGTTTFTDTDFLATNLNTGLTGTFTVDSGTSALYLNVTAIPEPKAALLGSIGLLLLLRRRR